MRRVKTPVQRRSRTAVKLLLLVQAALAIGVLAFLVQRTDVRVPILGSPPFELAAAFDDAAGLSATNRPAVLVSGVPAGRVADVRFERGKARVRMELDAGVSGRIFRDAAVRITGRSAINDLVVDVTPGHPDSGPISDGAEIPASRTSGPIGSDRVIDVLDTDTRAYLAVMITQLRRGLDGRASALAKSLAELDAFGASARKVTSALAERRRLVRRLVESAGVTFTALARRGPQITEAIRGGRAVLQATGSAERELAASIAVLPPAIGALNAALADVQRLAGPLVPALAGLRPVARGLPAVMRTTRRVLPDADRLLAEASRLSRDGRTSLRRLREALADLRPVVSQLLPGARRLPAGLDALADRGTGIGRFGQNFSGVFSTNDANGPVLRGLGFMEPFDPAHFGLPAASGGALKSTKRRVAQALVAACLKLNPAACLLGDRIPGLVSHTKALTDEIEDSPLPPLTALRRDLRRSGRD